jgi:hypothetical protein
LWWFWVAGGNVWQHWHFGRCGRHWLFCRCSWFFCPGGWVVVYFEIEVFLIWKLVHILQSFEVGWFDAVH